jgi:hypothetical protein
VAITAPKLLCLARGFYFFEPRISP